MAEPLIKDTFDTARLVACYRAIESERPGSLIQDPYARLLAGERGAQLVHAYERSSQEVWGTVLRTHIYDEILLRTIEQGQMNTVINLAAGLDARPYRLPLPASLHWIEVDFASILQYKEERLADAKPACKLERVTLDITESEALKHFLTSVSEEGRRILVLTEGLLVYLMAEQVAELARVLHEQEAVQLWLTEFITRLPPEKIRRAWNSIAAESVQERFVATNGAAFFAEYGWRVAEFQSVVGAIVRLNIPIRSLWFLRLLRRLKLLQAETDSTQSGFVVLKRASLQADKASDFHEEKISEQENQKETVS
jgi:methyltransferase (TIGR00027 family)